jgi:hypothetical protein
VNLIRLPDSFCSGCRLTAGSSTLRALVALSDESEIRSMVIVTDIDMFPYRPAPTLLAPLKSPQTCEQVSGKSEDYEGDENGSVHLSAL